MMIDKDALLKTRLTEAEVEIPGIGMIRVRGLSRGEVFIVQAAKGTQAMERKIISLGVVEPELTEVEVGQWQMASPAGELEPVVQAIQALSGLADGVDKETMRSFREQSGAGVRALPGTETVDDGEFSTGADEQR